MNPDPRSADLAAPRRRLWAALACAAIVAAGIAVYSNSFNGAFIFDDVSAIQENAALRSPLQSLVPPGKGGDNWPRRPVTNLTFALNYAFSGLDVRTYHAGNLLIHLLAALTLFGLIRRTLLLPALRDRFAGVSVALAAAVALIWTVHPLQTESVTYMTQRFESLMGLCYLLTLYCLARGASSEKPWRWYGAAIAACALGMGAKEAMVTAPVVALLYDRAFLSGSFGEAFRRRRFFYLGLAATWLVLGAILLLYEASGGAGFGLGIGAWEYARTQPGVILHYLRLSFWPNSLCFDYSWPIATSAWQIIPAAAGIAALLAGTLWALCRRPVLGFFGAWFFLILAPSSSFLPIVTEVAAEHRMYLPLAAVVAAAVFALYWIGKQFVRGVAESAATRKLLGGLLAAAALLSAAAALGYQTFERNTDYRDAISIWQDTVQKLPGNARALNNLGYAYSERGRADDAFLCFNKALDLKTDYPEVYNNRGVAFAKIGRPADAVRDLDKAIELKPEYAAAYNNRAAVRLSAGRYDEALADCDKAIALLPDYAQAYGNRGIALMGINRLVEAARDLDKAIELSPTFAAAYNYRAVLRLRAGGYIEALADWGRAIALQPGYADAYINRASAWYLMREYDKAFADLKTYEQLGGRPDPRFVEQLYHDAGRTK
ncbi:MAG: tetratricopeptide repeat protein [Candidatus Brocadiia bacterium]|jgi:tetratricopeptide (TPR) repeat protein